jgi:hypothetical protein
LSFFQGVLPSLQNLNDDQTIKFQLVVLNLLKNVKKHRPSFPPTQNFPLHQPIYNMPGFSGCSSIHPTASSYPQATQLVTDGTGKQFQHYLRLTVHQVIRSSEFDPSDI